MKKFITSLLAGIMALMTCVGIVGCKQEQTVTIGYTLYEPMNYMNEAGQFVGFDTELAKKVFGDLGYKIRFKEIVWDNKYLELNSGAIDCIWNGFTANCADADGVQRSTKVDFTYNYMQNAQCVVRSTSTPEATDVSQFAGTSIAYEAGSAADSYVSNLVGNINKKSVSSQMAAIQEVNAGTAQYAVVDVLLAQSIAGQGNYANVVINEGISIAAEYYAIGFKKGSSLTAKVNAQLVKYAQDGSLAALANKYGLSYQVITDYSDQM